MLQSYFDSYPLPLGLHGTNILPLGLHGANPLPFGPRGANPLPLGLVRADDRPGPITTVAPCGPMLPFTRGNRHTRGNVWKVRVGITGMHRQGLRTRVEHDFLWHAPHVHTRALR